MVQARTLVGCVGLFLSCRIIRTIHAFSASPLLLQKRSIIRRAQSWPYHHGQLERRRKSSPNSFLSSSELKCSNKKNSASTASSNILILDHLNINHEEGRHDLVKAFYFEFLECAVDPRKEENIIQGRGTIWANIGSNQFHLPEGKPLAQVFKGIITLTYPNVDELRKKKSYPQFQNVFRDTKFAAEELSKDGSHNDDHSFVDGILVTDPWGTKFKILQPTSTSDDASKDPRGTQKGDPSVGFAMKDLTIYTPKNINMDGIARFYEQIFGAWIVQCNKECCVVSVGPSQTLTFAEKPQQTNHHYDTDTHVDLRDEQQEGKEEKDGGNIISDYPSNYGPHISLYVADLRGTYQRAKTFGITYVNPRFKRRAYTEEEAVDDCMFRCMDIIDPDNAHQGVILRLEHEVRSVIKRDGSIYKSCPFDEIPVGCTI